jgi:hypothetical protein
MIQEAAFAPSDPLIPDLVHAQGLCGDIRNLFISDSHNDDQSLGGFRGQNLQRMLKRRLQTLENQVTQSNQKDGEVFRRCPLFIR